MDSALFFFLMKNYKISVRHHKSLVGNYKTAGNLKLKPLTTSNKFMA